MEAIRIREEPDYVDFEAKTAEQAVTKFLRMNRLYPGPWNNADHLLAAGSDLQNQEEYDKFIQWICDPTSQSTKAKYAPLPEHEHTFSRDNFEMGCVDYAVNQSADVVKIHIKNTDWAPPENQTDDEEDEKKEEVEEEKVE